jgi:hypothetical protein
MWAKLTPLEVPREAAFTRELTAQFTLHARGNAGGRSANISSADNKMVEATAALVTSGSLGLDRGEL